MTKTGEKTKSFQGFSAVVVRLMRMKIFCSSRSDFGKVGPLSGRCSIHRDVNQDQSIFDESFIDRYQRNFLHLFVWDIDDIFVVAVAVGSRDQLARGKTRFHSD